MRRHFPYRSTALIGVLVVVCILAVRGCKDIPPESFVTGVRSASGATLYEGLPHQRFEEQALEQELATKATVQLHGFPFYQETLALRETDERTLLDIMCANDTFAAFSGEKRCGGFHPDYCVEWRGSDGNAYCVLVCLGCHEAKLCGPVGEVRCDVQEAVYGRLKAILTPYRKNRPAQVPSSGRKATSTAVQQIGNGSG